MIKTAYLKMMKYSTMILLGLVALTACSSSDEQAIKENEYAHQAYDKFLSGDMSLLDSSKERWYVPDFNEDKDFEYTLMDLDGDKRDELVVQVVDDPGSYNAVFHYEDGHISCWFSDSVEVVCFNYPLKNGLMCEEYNYAGSISYNVYRYLSTGETKPEKYLFIREEPAFPDEELTAPIYKIDEKDVTKEEFEKELNKTVTDHLLSRTAWKKITEIEESK